MSAYVASAKKNWPMIIWGIISVVIGVLLLFLPRMMAVADIVIGIWVGVTFIIDGIFYVSMFITDKQSVSKTILTLILGFLIILAGLFCIVKPVLGIALLGLVITATFIVIGIAAIVNCVNLYRTGFPYWWVMIIIAIVFILAGILMFCFPNSWGILLPILAGIHFIVDGIAFVLNGNGKSIVA